MGRSAEGVGCDGLEAGRVDQAGELQHRLEQLSLGSDHWVAKVRASQLEGVLVALLVDVLVAMVRLDLSGGARGGRGFGRRVGRSG